MKYDLYVYLSHKVEQCFSVYRLESPKPWIDWALLLKKIHTLAIPIFKAISCGVRQPTQLFLFPLLFLK